MVLVPLCAVLVQFPADLHNPRLFEAVQAIKATKRSASNSAAASSTRAAAGTAAGSSAAAAAATAAIGSITVAAAAAATAGSGAAAAAAAATAAASSAAAAMAFPSCSDQALTGPSRFNQPHIAGPSSSNQTHVRGPTSSDQLDQPHDEADFDRHDQHLGEDPPESLLTWVNQICTYMEARVSSSHVGE